MSGENVERPVDGPRGARWIMAGVATVALLCCFMAWRLQPQAAQARERMQAFLAVDKYLDPPDCVQASLPTALVLEALLCVALLGTWYLGRRKLRCETFPQQQQPAATQARSHRALWLLTAAIMVTSGLWNAPRLRLSLWNDEVLTLSNFVVGQVNRSKKSGQLRFDDAPWSDTVYGYWMPNNHVLYSITARLSHAVWPKSRGDSASYFSEVGLRVPAYLAGLAAIAGLTLLGLRLGLPEAGVLAAGLLVLHPWHVQYGTEARGYSFVLALMPLLFWVLVEAARTGRWRWWIAAGAVEFCLGYSYVLSVHVIWPAVLGAVLLSLHHHKCGRDRLTVLARMVTGGLLAGLPAVILGLPLLPQMRQYLHTADRSGFNFDWGFGSDALSEWLTGIPWQTTYPGHPYSSPWDAWAHIHPWLMTGALLATAVVWISGIITLWRHSMATRCLLPALVLPAFELVAVNSLQHVVLKEWYLLIALPGLIFLMAVGLVGLARATTHLWRMDRWSVPVTGVMACLLFGWATHFQRSVLRSHPIEPRREAAKLFRETLNYRDSRVEKVVSACRVRDVAYDPGAYRVETKEDILDIAALARDTHRPFYFTSIHYDLEKQYLNQEGIKFVETSGLFEPVQLVHGVSEDLTIAVFKYRDQPGDAAHPSSAAVETGPAKP